MYSHFIFDFDGTISDSYPLFLGMYREIAADCGLHPTCTDDELYRATKGTGMEGYRCVGLDQVITYPEFIDRLNRLQCRDYLKFQPFPEIRPILDAIVSSGKKCYVYTHTRAVVKDMLRNMGLLEYFTFVLDGTRNFPRKPAPDAMFFLLSECNIPAGDALMIGDRPIDTDAAKGAGVDGCLWDVDGLYPDALPTHKIRTLNELYDLIH